MPRVRDFRQFAFRPDRVDRCGRNIGTKVYWKLYAIENTIRIVLHSVLSVQVNPNWWSLAVDARIVGNVQRFRRNYAANLHNASPGTHDIHLTFLSDLTEIMRANSHLISPVVPTTNQWILTLEANSCAAESGRSHEFSECLRSQCDRCGLRSVAIIAGSVVEFATSNSHSHSSVANQRTFLIQVPRAAAMISESAIIGSSRAPARSHLGTRGIRTVPA